MAPTNCEETLLNLTSRRIGSKRHWTAISLSFSLSLPFSCIYKVGFSEKQSVFGRPADKPQVTKTDLKQQHYNLDCAAFCVRAFSSTYNIP